jgi:hypothetical protein
MFDIIFLNKCQDEREKIKRKKGKKRIRVSSWIALVQLQPWLEHQSNHCNVIHVSWYWTFRDVLFFVYVKKDYSNE